MSFTSLLGIVACVGCVGFMFVFKKRLDTQYAHLKAGALASRLGMQMTKGSPEHNLCTMSVYPSANNLKSGAGWGKSMLASSFGGNIGVFELHMGNSQAELSLYAKEDMQLGVYRQRTTTAHDLRLTRFARIPSPFVLYLRNPMQGMEIQRPVEAGMPMQSFGDPRLDQMFVIEAHDPSVPQRIRPIVEQMMELSLYAHVDGSPRGISWVMTPAAVNYSSMYFEKLLPMLGQMASALEGRPVLARIA